MAKTAHIDKANTFEVPAFKHRLEKKLCEDTEGINISLFFETQASAAASLAER